MMSKKRLVYTGIILSSFLLGAYVWKINHTGAFFWRGEDKPQSADEIDFTVYVGDYLITREEVEWEYRLYMSQLSAPETGSQSESRPMEGAPKEEESKAPKMNLELYNKILADLIERKLLYQYLKSDSKFNINDISRYTRCMEEFITTGTAQPQLVKLEKDRENLKAMLCEKSILDQYVAERVNAEAVPSEDELKAYYTENKRKMVEPQRVVIRQIVLGSEDDAKKLRDKVTAQNFADMARQHSISPEAKEGGLLGPFAQGELPSVFDIAFEMKPGGIQGILKSTYGFHILMLEKKIPRVELSFEAAKPKILKQLAEKRQSEEYKKWVDSALNSIPIRSSRTL